jgi:hypothetical protein
VQDQADLFDGEPILEVADQAEGFDDVAAVGGYVVSQSVVSGTDWTAETIINQIDKGNIQLNPKFQRRDAWEGHRKSSFIESLILGLPIPQIVLAESKTKRGSYIVIDGKQRLLSIRQFAAKHDDQVFSQLRLTGLSIRRDLHLATLESLRLDPAFADDVAAFENQPIRTVVIKNWGEEDFLYQVFLRLNTGSVPLSTQELRQALHPGPFVDFIEETSAESPGMRKVLNLRKPDFRMRDAELLTRWYAFRYFAPEYSGQLKTFLDRACETLNRQWQERTEVVHMDLEQFEAAVATAYAVFGANAFRKWSRGTYERLFNRAIFDIVTYYFADPTIRSAAELNPPAVEAAFKDLCQNNTEFLAAVERTTKSIGATTTRMSLWARALSSAAGIDVHSPIPPLA